MFCLLSTNICLSRLSAQTLERRLGIHHRAQGHSGCPGGTGTPLLAAATRAPASPVSQRGPEQRARPRPRRAPGAPPLPGRAHVTAPEKWVKGRGGAAPPRPRVPGRSRPFHARREGAAKQKFPEKRAASDERSRAHPSAGREKGCARLGRLCHSQSGSRR